MTAKQENQSAGASAPFFAAWYGKAWIVGVLFVLAGVAVYLFRSAIVDAYRSAHEAYGVIAEEVAEMFDAIRADDDKHARSEAIQVAACCLRFAAEGWAR